MSGRSRDSPPIAVREHDGDLQQVQANAEASSPTPAPSTSTSSFAPQLSRLRTHLTGRRTTARAEATSSRSPNANFNPEAIEFVPTPKMPPKRKASNTGRSEKSTLSSLRNSTSNRHSLDQPIIWSEELFGRSPSTRSIINDVFDGSFDSDETSDVSAFESMGLVNDALNRTRDRITDAFSLFQRGKHGPRRRSAELLPPGYTILFSCDGDGSTAEEPDEPLRLRYLPLCPATNPGSRESKYSSIPLTIVPSHRERIDGRSRTSSHVKATWPAGRVPMELFDLIATHLSRDAVKSMRLVNHEFEEKVSSALFHTSVVPFNTELYDMIDEDSRAVHRATSSAKGKGKAGPRNVAENSAELSHGSLHWTNAKYDAEGKVYKGHGLRVFQGFGPHIKRFGMSFDVLESQLSRPPIKRELDHVDSYHGSYDWPPERYTRFANLAGLEKTADETLRMKSAFSHLTNVHDLALSVDSGLGWLNGPDKSIHSRVFERQSPIFGHSRLVPDHQTQDANDFWETIQACNRSLGAFVNSKEISLGRKALAKHPTELSGLRGTHYGDRTLWSSIAADRAAPTISDNVSEDMQYGIMYTTVATPESTAQSLYDKSALVPSELRKEQKEWLLETEWAQRAFLECYMLAVMDNPDKFTMVKTLAVAKVSSGFLPLLARESFWDALPNLTDVTILVKPDWRSVERDNAGFAETCPQNPSEAVRTFHRCLLRDRLCLRPGIKTLNIGWASGGEHADGIFARNNHIMPAPTNELEQITAASPNLGLVFSFVEHLTLTNCWITPPMLEELVKTHAEKNLTTLTLNSVSLTAHPRFPGAGQGGIMGQGPFMQQVFANLAGMQGGAAPAQANQANAQNILVPQNQPPHPWFMNVNAAQAHGINQLHQQQQQQQQQQVMHNWIQQNQQNNLFGNPFGGGNALVQAPLIPPNANALVGANVPAPPHHGPALFGQLPPAPAPPAPHLQNNANPVAQATHTHWSSDHREGSWPEVLNTISPGPIYNDYLPQPPPWDEQHPPRAPTSLRKLELVSCGYAKLYHNTAFDQFLLEAGHEHQLSVWFRTRQAALAPAMLTNTDRYLGRIVQYMPLREQNALLLGWGLTMGWDDRSKAEEAEYDGLLAGGTGRFSGIVEKDMELVDQPQA